MIAVFPFRLEALCFVLLSFRSGITCSGVVTNADVKGLSDIQEHLGWGDLWLTRFDVFLTCSRVIEFF